MNSKKLIITIGATILAVALIVTSIILAVSRGDCIISIDNQAALAGNTVNLSVNIKNNPGIWGGQIIIDYDPHKVSFNSASNGSVFDACEFNDTGSSVVLLVTQTALKNTKEDGAIATISFNIKSTAENGKIDIRLNDETNFCNAKEELVETVFENGYITIK